MQHSEMNGSKYCMKLSSFFSQDHGLQFCQDLTYIKPHLRQSDSDTSQAM